MTRRTARWQCTRCGAHVTTYVPVSAPPACTCGRGLKPRPMTIVPEEDNS